MERHRSRKVVVEKERGFLARLQGSLFALALHLGAYTDLLRQITPRSATR